jgi:iron complex outermembrane recepter protein
MKNFTYLFIFMLLPTVFFGQKLTGTVKDGDGGPVIGATIYKSGTSIGTVTDIDGKYELLLGKGTHDIVYSFIGFSDKVIAITIEDQDVISDINMSQANTMLEEVIVTGGRVGGRSRISSPVPVDVIPISAVTSSVGQVDLNQILTYIAPSFQSSRQTISDGTDHIDPAQLRGLGPDQVLVLINGKRRHQSALVNVNGTVNRGTVGTDLNAIPAYAVEKIEILRDGAAAQYGSDAIAGVINIILKNKKGLSGIVGGGAHVTSYDKNYATDRTAPKVSATDGENINAALSYGLGVGEKGFLNVTADFAFRGLTNRTGTYNGQIYPLVNGANVDASTLQSKGITRDFFDMRIGNSEVTGGGLMANFSMPVGKNELYAFGGVNSKGGNAAGFYRYPNAVPAAVRTNVFAVYPEGFLPEINSTVLDASLAFGLRGKLGMWNFDLSNAFGRNTFNFDITNSVNYTQALTGSNFQREFDAGGSNFMQNTINADLSRKFDVGEGINVAGGAEFRIDQYGIRAGEEASWRNYNTASGVAAGAQVFAGFLPSNEGTNSRNSVAGYIDIENNLTKELMLATALRFENYSDFGSTLNYKVAARYKMLPGFAFRASTSSGFRAPSMQQRFYSKTNTVFVSQGGTLVPQEQGTFTNESKPAEILGIPTLKQETSTSFTVGATLQAGGNFEITLDAYQIDIDDRIVLTNNFGAAGNATLAAQLSAANATQANFFTNAIDTRSRGVESVVTYNKSINKHNFRIMLAGTVIDNSVKKDAQDKPIVKASPILIATNQVGAYFNREDQSRIEVANPRNKLTATLNYKFDKIGLMLRAVRFGQVQYLDPTIQGVNANTWPVNAFTGLRESLDQTFSAKTVTDLSLSYDVTKNVMINIGANNLLDTYQDLHTHSGNMSLGRFLYSRRVQQMGFNGRFIFGKVSFNF